MLTLPAVVALLALPPDLGLRASGIIMGLGCALLAAREAKNSAGIVLTPISFMFAEGVISIGFSTYGMGTHVAEGKPIAFATYELSPESVAIGEAIFLAGVLAFHAGLQITRPAPAAPSRRPTRAYFVSMCCAVWVVGFAVRLLRFGYASLDIFSVGTSAVLACMLLVQGVAGKRGVWFWALISVAVAIEVFFGIKSGLKGEIMRGFIPVLWYLLVNRRLRIWIVPFLGGLTLLYFGLVYPIVETARREFGGEWYADPISAYLRVYDRGFDTGSTAEETDVFLDRFYLGTPTAFLYREVELHGYRMGETLANLKFAFVPRILWPDKPEVTRAAWFTVYTGQARSEKYATTATGMTTVGELYWNFGLIGVVAGMLAIGAVAGIAWRVAGSEPELDPLRMIMYNTVVYWTTAHPEASSDIIAEVTVLLVVGIPILLMDRLARKRGWVLPASSADVDTEKRREPGG